MFLVCNALTCMMCICTQSVKKCPIKEIPDGFQKTTDSDSFQHKIIPYNKPQNNVFVCKQHAFIGHQQHAVGGLAEEAVVHAFVQKASLLPAGFGRQAHRHLLLQRIRRQLDKGREALPILRQDILKVDVQLSVAQKGHAGPDLLQKPDLRLGILQKGVNQVVAELAVLTQGRQNQGRTDSRGCGPLRQPSVGQRRRQQPPLRREAVGKHRQLAEKRQRFPQHPGTDVRVSIAAHIDGQRPLLDPVQNQQRLACHQHIRIRDLIEGRNLSHRHAVLPGDAPQSVPRLYHIDHK